MCYFPSFLNPSSSLSRLFLPFLLLFFSGYSLAHLLFKNESFIDRIIIGYGFSVLLNVIIFHGIMFIRNNGLDQAFNTLFLIITLFATAAPLCLSYFRATSINRFDPNTKTEQKAFFEQSDIKFIGAVMLLIFLVQILFINPRNSVDEYSYIYIARNLTVDNTNFTATPPWINKERYVPRYVFITQIAVFCSFFGFKLESAEFVIFAANLMLIPVVFSSTSTFFNRKVGTVAAALIAVNPVFWNLNIKIYPDISVTVFSWASFYFLLKALKNGDEELIEKKFVALSFIFLILAQFTKYTVVFLVPAFFLLFFIYNKNRIGIRVKNFSSYLVVLICSLSFILTLVRFWPDLVDFFENFSVIVEAWNLATLYDSMIKPLGPISQFSVIILLGIFLSLKSELGRRNLTIFIASWVGYLPFFLLYPHFFPDPRYVFSQQVTVTILAAFGIVSISKQRKLWKISLLVISLAHVIDVSLKWKGSRQTLFLIDVLLLIALLIFLQEGIRRTARKKALAAHSLQKTILLGLTLLAFVNASVLERYDVTWEEQIVAESRIQAVSYLETVGGWLNMHITENESIMTNAYATLPYYARFVTIYVPPEEEEEFLSCSNQKNMKYLVIFWGTRPFLQQVLGALIILDEAPYLERYVWKPPLNTRQVYSDNDRTIDDKEVGVVIFEIY